jgi:uncharacterized protein (TIGR00297 family)
VEPSVVDATVLEAAIGLLVAMGFSLLAYGMHVLDRLGSALAFLFAVAIILAPGLDAVQGYLWLLLLILFVVVGFVITKMFWQQKKAKGVTESKKGVRGWRNVAANGLVPAGLALMTGVLDADLVAVGFVTAVAAASSDTFASELGVLSDRTYLLVNPRRSVPPGMNGGVSNWGHLMALLGALVPSVVGVLLIGVPWSMLWVPVTAGFVGCQLDSVLGALFEEERGRVYGFMSKSDVNFLAIFVASFTVLLVLAL